MVNEIYVYLFIVGRSVCDSVVIVGYYRCEGLVLVDIENYRVGFVIL